MPRAVRPADRRRGAPRRPRRAAAGATPSTRQQTRLIRRLAPHFEHRLFLSATPHNGYQESFTALLELLDPSGSPAACDPTGGRSQRGAGPPAQARDRERRRHARASPARQIVDARRSSTRTSERAVHAAARRVRRAAPARAAPPDAGRKRRRPGHAAAEEAAVLLARPRSRTRSTCYLRDAAQRRPARPATAAADERRRVARRVPRRRPSWSTTRRCCRPRTTRSTAPAALQPTTPDRREELDAAGADAAVGARATTARADAKAARLLDLAGRASAGPDGGTGTTSG